MNKLICIKYYDFGDGSEPVDVGTIIQREIFEDGWWVHLYFNGKTKSIWRESAFDIFSEEFFQPLAEYRQKRIDEILND